VFADAKSDIAVGAARVCDVPDVNPDIVNDINDGTVNEWVEVTEHETDAAVDAIVHVCAALTRADTAIKPATTTNLRNMLLLRGFGLASSPAVMRPNVSVPPPSDSVTQLRASSPRQAVGYESSRSRNWG
jgi:hypothetical protein